MIIIIITTQSLVSIKVLIYMITKVKCNMKLCIYIYKIISERLMRRRFSPFRVCVCFEAAAAAEWVQDVGAGGIREG